MVNGIVAVSMFLLGFFAAAKFASECLLQPQNILSQSLQPERPRQQELPLQFQQAQPTQTQTQIQTPAFVPLPSGWDSNGLSIQSKVTSQIYSTLLESDSTINTYTTFPLGPVRSLGIDGLAGGAFLKNNLNGSPKWEKLTFKTFLMHVPGHKVYVDFGSWIGPTLFFNAQMVERAYAIEADPAAFSVVSCNLVLNSNSLWYSRVNIQGGGVGAGSNATSHPVSVSMKSASSGNSCSGMMDKVNCGEVTTKWDVNTYTLPFLFQRWSIQPEEAFVKVDTEAYECVLVPSWFEWLQSLPTKPTFTISFHSYVVSCSDEQYEGIGKVLRLFRSIYLNGKILTEQERQQSFKKYGGEDLLLTDREY